eukprot:6402203-Amphidinium_carterae.1
MPCWCTTPDVKPACQPVTAETTSAAVHARFVKDNKVCDLEGNVRSTLFKRAQRIHRKILLHGALEVKSSTNGGKKEGLSRSPTLCE